jgi:hypothetical protein
MAIDTIQKQALSLVALDRQLAQATMQAIRRWARTKKATQRVFAAMLLADEIAIALEDTRVPAKPRAAKTG